MRGGLRITLSVVAALSVAFFALGCGSSDKPEYCSETSDLQQSADDLKNDVTSANVSALKSDLQTVQSDANAVVNSAKQDFPSETSAIQSSVSALSTAVQDLPSSPSGKQLAQLTPDVSAVVTAVNGFSSATESDC